MTERADRSAHAAAIRAALEASGREVFTYTELAKIAPEQRPDNYILFDLSRVFGGAQMNDGTDGTSLWRVGTRAVSDDDENAGVLLDDCRDALEGLCLDVDGSSTGPVTFETEIPIAPDDGKYSGLIDWTYDHS